MCTSRSLIALEAHFEPARDYIILLDDETFQSIQVPARDEPMQLNSLSNGPVLVECFKLWKKEKKSSLARADLERRSSGSNRAACLWKICWWDQFSEQI